MQSGKLHQENADPNRLMVEFSNDAMFLVDPGKARFIDVNRRACESLGYGRDELLAMEVMEIETDFPADFSWNEHVRAVKEAGSLLLEGRQKRKDGSTFPVEVSVRYVSGQDGDYMIAIARDITERKQAEQAILDEKKFSEELIESLPDIFFLVDQRADLLRWNRRLEELFGLSSERMQGVSAMLFVDKNDRKKVANKLQEVFTRGSATVEARLRLSNGVRDYLLVGKRIDTSLGANAIGFGMDISERKQIERTLEKSESRLREAQEVAHLGSWELDLVENILWWSDENYKVFGVTPEKNTYETFLSTVHPDDRAFVDQAYTGSVKNHTQYDIEHRLLMPDGSVKWVNERCQTYYAEDGTPLRSIGTTLDITERKLAEETLRSSHDLLRSIIENIPVRVFWKDRELRYLGCNSAFARDAGMQQPEELCGKDDFQMAWRDEAELYRGDDRQVIETGEAKLGYEEPQTTPDGRTIWLRTSKVPLQDGTGGVAGMLGMYEDITAWHETQARLQHLNRALATLSACNHALVYAGSEEALWQGVCRAIVEKGGYGLAWIGYAEQDEGKRIKLMASHAATPGYTDDIHISWDDAPEGHGPTGTAVRQGKTQYVQDIASDPAMAPWREKALAFGYRASIGLPLFEDGKPFGVLTIYASEPDAFNKEELALLEELAGDLAFGIHTLRTSSERDSFRDEQQRTLKRLSTSLEQTIQAMANTVELRDPYTSGHQKRTASLAKAIADKLGMQEQQIRGLYLAGAVLDLGKIKIPAEILNYPGQLNEMQMKLVRSHAQAGFDILKDIDFPWPVAQIVLQHHERMDGSGYPQGLKGDEILPEARILAVADTVEAMSSHRPYRASLGLDAALNELRRNRGTLYDAAAVDACCELFVHDGHKLDGWEEESA